MYLGFVRPKSGTMRSGRMAGLDFGTYLFLAPNGPGTPVFGRHPKSKDGNAGNMKLDENDERHPLLSSIPTVVLLIQ